MSDNEEQSSLGITANHFMAIGHMAVVWSMLEFLLGTAIWRLASLKALDGLVITDRMSVPRKLDILRILIERNVGEDAANDFAELAATISDLRSKRNAAIHGNWLNSDKPNVGISLVIRTGGKLKTHSIEFSYEELSKIGNDISDTSIKLFDFFEKHNIPSFDISPALAQLPKA